MTFLAEKVRRDFLMGKITGEPVIPTQDQIERKVQDIKPASSPIPESREKCDC